MSSPLPAISVVYGLLVLEFLLLALVPAVVLLPPPIDDFGGGIARVITRLSVSASES